MLSMIRTVLCGFLGQSTTWRFKKYQKPIELLLSFVAYHLRPAYLLERALQEKKVRDGELPEMLKARKRELPEIGWIETYP